MTSYFAQMFLELQARISTAVPEIKYTDIDLKQIDIYEERPAVSLPCVLIDFTDTTYDQLLQQVQTGNCNISFRLAFPAYSPTSSIFPGTVKEQGLQFFEIENKLYKALQGWQPESGITQPLTRTSARTEEREDGLRVRAILFSTSFEDTEASQKAKLPAGLAIQFV